MQNVGGCLERIGEIVWGGKWESRPREKSAAGSASLVGQIKKNGV
jgi:hypothetical protein